MIKNFLFPTVLLVFASLGATARTVPVPAQGATIVIPDDWTLLKRPGVVLVASAPGETAALGILVSANHELRQAATPDDIEAMKQGLLAKAAKQGVPLHVIDAGPRQINGVPAGFVQTEQDFPGGHVIYSRAYDLAADGKLFLLTLDATDKRTDPALQAMAESFRFNRPPEVPGPSDFFVHRLGEIGGVVLLLGLAAYLTRLGLQWRRKATETT